ncbi:MAG: glycosyltransferase family 2 protein [Shewanella algae]|uniref:glycosyltransferase family 2 protein n=1 Tax=Shewanella algae TaxID=38313 RepID=UPI00118236C3|nr:glycosyltransferase family 2 protein [Shewanella algae]MDO8254736.1 glycosyltransferase family 2 protein [Shewanella algae]QTE86562.1 glycosyltransferase family 2 protein [Shewanella algae]TVL39997.1 capsular biosynthesis protein [Shewanella algae]
MIVIPMAGLSSRFFKAGYQEPKYMLPAHGKPLFDHALLSFSRYFATMPFLFIVRDVYNTPEFVEKRCRQLGIKDYRIVSLTEATRGQAETVYLGLTDVDPQTPLTIFNIDTFRPGFSFPAITEHCDGYLEVFKGEGSNWSYAKPAAVNSTLVVETAEKKPISDLCSTGLYYFRHAADFCAAYTQEAAKPASEWQKQELYIAPLYNYLISQGKQIHYHLIERDEVIFCGVPEEYLSLLAQAD